ncbi:hypothetical protein [uncultured Roseivirga sp.]|uniref:hypothetical protein n=1 Tax=uncultured Roseivirga sp. TaxID=543088 RepID=UPI0030D95421|tara:strand:+ start:166316 stop:166960 length:645 start_codon:yes stop_codon:yes gene_type:complete
MPREYTPLEVKMKEYTSINKTMVFILICIISFLLLFIQQTFIISEINAFKFMDGMESLVFQAIAGLKYIGVPIVYAWKFTLIGFVLWTGCFLWGYRVTYKQCWQIAMFAEMIFFIPEILTILWFFFIDTDPTYWDVKAFEPLSYMNFFNHEEVPEKYWYVNSALNVFEIGYWILLTYGVNFAARKKKSIANAIVFTTYVPLFLLWLWFYLGVYK